MQFCKLFCPIHPTELITNYCADSMTLSKLEQSLEGLCATCVCYHTKLHQRKGKYPSYENIKSTHQRINEKMKSQINQIEDDKEWFNEVCSKIDQKNLQVKQILNKARKDCLNLINDHFDDLEAKVSTQIANQAKKSCFDSSPMLDSFNTLIMMEISNLLFYSSELSQPVKLLDTIKKVERDIFASSEKFHQKVCEELISNEVQSTSVIYNEQVLRDISLKLKNLVNLKCIYPHLHDEDEEAEVKRVEPSQSESIQKSSSCSGLQTKQSLKTSPVHQKNPKPLIRSTPSFLFASGRNANQLLIPNQILKNTSQVFQPLQNKPKINNMMTSFGQKFQESSMMTSFGQSLTQFKEPKRQKQGFKANKYISDKIQEDSKSSISSVCQKQNKLVCSIWVDTSSSTFIK